MRDATRFKGSSGSEVSLIFSISFQWSSKSELAASFLHKTVIIHNFGISKIFKNFSITWPVIWDHVDGDHVVIFYFGNKVD